MVRRKKHTAHANHERWIVSYADFVTLLFAFFVVMFATANADKGKAGVVAAAVRAALNQTKPANVASGTGELPGQGSSVEKGKAASDARNDENAARMARAMSELLPSMQLLEKALRPEIDKGNVEVHMAARGLTISFKQAAFFDSGSDLVRASALPTVAKVGEALLKIPNSVRLEGHTDNIPISTGRFGSNWELSSSRAISVLDVLTTKFQVPRTRLAVGGYADVAPVASNDTEDGRARNRRVDVVILSDYGASNEPPGKETASAVQPAKKTS
jgi:chemotaxis protein MotB